MIRNPAIYAAFQRQQIRNEPVDYSQNLRIFDAMYSYARRMGVLESPRARQEIEAHIRLARALNVRRTDKHDRAGTA